MGDWARTRMLGEGGWGGGWPEVELGAGAEELDVGVAPEAVPVLQHREVRPPGGAPALPGGGQGPVSGGRCLGPHAWRH